MFSHMPKEIVKEDEKVAKALEESGAKAKSREKYNSTLVCIELKLGNMQLRMVQLKL